jgi:hypothetical protein
MYESQNTMVKKATVEKTAVKKTTVKKTTVKKTTGTTQAYQVREARILLCFYGGPKNNLRSLRGGGVRPDIILHHCCQLPDMIPQFTKGTPA